jgi:hypothetical protein
MYYYEAQESGDGSRRPWDILEGEKSYMFIALYTLDFLICMTLLVLFHMYSRKSTQDEERLKKYYLMSLRGGGADRTTHQ